MLTILIVDDEKNIRETLSDFLRLTGYEAITAENGNDALHQIRNHAPDLVICDLLMPKIGGYECLKAVKKDFEEIKIIMLTGILDDKIYQKCIDAGADDILTKPFDFLELEEKIDNLYTR